MAKTRKDLTGVVFGRLTVIEQAEDHISPSGVHSTKWLCQCSCGSAPKAMLTMSLVRGLVVSCGCYRREVTGSKSRTHAMTGTATYNSWRSIAERCTNQNHKDYRNYGGRGIMVCDRWKKFENFYEDMGECPDGTTLDRIDVNGNYGKENCRWANRSEQGYNQRKRGNNTSGKSGVSWNERLSKWMVRISKDGVRYYLGCYSSIEDATAVREEAELNLFGYNRE